MKQSITLIVLALFGNAAVFADTAERPAFNDSCAEESRALAERIVAPGNVSFQLLVVNTADVGIGDLVVGLCEQDQKKIVFTYSIDRKHAYFAGL